MPPRTTVPPTIQEVSDAPPAAPVARVLLAQWFNQKKTFIAGTSHTR